MSEGGIKLIFKRINYSVNTNDFVAALKEKWDELSLYSVVVATILSASEAVAIIQKYHSHNYGSGIIFGYTMINPIYIVISGGIWRDPITIS